jgi:hypothetical protein
LLWYSQNHKFTSETFWLWLTRRYHSSANKKIWEERKIKEFWRRKYFPINNFKPKKSTKRSNLLKKYWKIKSKQNFGIKKSSLKRHLIQKGFFSDSINHLKILALQLTYLQLCECRSSRCTLHCKLVTWRTDLIYNC